MNFEMRETRADSLRPRYQQTPPPSPLPTSSQFIFAARHTGRLFQSHHPVRRLQLKILRHSRGGWPPFLEWVSRDSEYSKYIEAKKKGEGGGGADDSTFFDSFSVIGNQKKSQNIIIGHANVLSQILHTQLLRNYQNVSMIYLYIISIYRCVCISQNLCYF